MRAQFAQLLTVEEDDGASAVHCEAALGLNGLPMADGIGELESATV